MTIKLRDYQINAITKMKNGCILAGDTGTGKSLTALGYYYMYYGGSMQFLSGGEFKRTMRFLPNLYIITTAKKRDTHEWESEMAPFHLSLDPKEDIYSEFGHLTVIDSWNNIAKYADVKNSFFIFDEQRLVGKGKWVKAFLKIAKVNHWILLSATPGDKWEDYIPVFVANGFYRNKTEFTVNHCIYSRFTKWPQITGYFNEGRLIKLREEILVDMECERPTIQHHEYINCSYDIPFYKKIIKERWDPYKNEPVKTASELCYLLRKVTNMSDDRQMKYLEIVEDHPRIIVFYNFDYELDILKTLPYPEGTVVAECNGHKHDPVPNTERWIYLVQYSAGAEAWNCITTNAMIFYSQNYSYKTTKQACGRIDRMNTSYVDLYYYHLKSIAGIDLAIYRALVNKKKFNERKFVEKRLI